MNSPNTFGLSGRVAFVTGGNGGIGLGIALGLAQAGASVIIAGRNTSKNETALSQLKAVGVSCEAIQLDVENRDSFERVIKAIVTNHGTIDILVNNAGISGLSGMGGILNQEPSSWDQVLETNLTSAFLLSKIVAADMVKQGRGKIINITSEYSRFGSASFPAYSTSKGALEQLTYSMAVELAPHNIQVNAIAPGWIETDMTAPIKGLPLEQEILMRTPAGRWGKPGDLAGAAVFFASSASDFVTGTALFVDGGYAIR